jgi:SWIM zinc finger
MVRVKAQPREKTLPQRAIRLLRSPGPGAAGLMAITNQRKTNYYAFNEIPCEIGGRAFALHRLGLGNLYNVRVGRSADCSCECLGFLQHGRCKHVMGLLALTGHELI